MIKSARIRIAINAQKNMVFIDHLSADNHYICSRGTHGTLCVSNASLIRITRMIHNTQFVYHSSNISHNRSRNFYLDLRFNGWSIIINRADIAAYNSMIAIERESTY